MPDILPLWNVRCIVKNVWWLVEPAIVSRMICAESVAISEYKGSCNEMCGKLPCMLLQGPLYRKLQHIRHSILETTAGSTTRQPF